MSNWEEHSIVIVPEEEQHLLKDYVRYKDVHQVRNFNRIYAGEKLIVYFFDANGDGPWEIESDTKAKLIAAETSYLDGEDLWTRIEGNEDGNISLAEWLEDKIPPDDYIKVKEAMRYTDDDERHSKQAS